MILSGDVTSVSKAKQCFDIVEEYVNDFTDSPYTPHEHRELIVLTCQKCKEEIDQLGDMSNVSILSTAKIFGAPYFLKISPNFPILFSLFIITFIGMNRRTI